MTSPARSTRTLEDRARFGLGFDTQDDESDPSNTETNLTVEGVLDVGAGLESADVTIADVGGYTTATEVESAIQQLYGRTRVDYQVDDLIIDTTVGDGSTLRDTSLVIPVLASGIYAVEATLFVTCTTNCGVKVGFTAPASATFAWAIQIFGADNVVDRDGEQAIGDSHGNSAACTFDVVKVAGLLTVSATGGNLTLQAAQNADHADDTVIHGESFITAIKLN